MARTSGFNEGTTSLDQIAAAWSRSPTPDEPPPAGDTPVARAGGSGTLTSVGASADGAVPSGAPAGPSLPAGVEASRRVGGGDDAGEDDGEDEDEDEDEGS